VLELGCVLELAADPELLPAPADVLAPWLVVLGLVAVVELEPLTLLVVLLLVPLLVPYVSLVPPWLQAVSANAAAAQSITIDFFIAVVFLLLIVLVITTLAVFRLPYASGSFLPAR
jgi:hypothetical protein